MDPQLIEWVNKKLAGTPYTAATVHTATSGDHTDLSGWALSDGFITAARGLAVLDRRAAMAADGIWSS